MHDIWQQIIDNLDQLARNTTPPAQDPIGFLLSTDLRKVLNNVQRANPQMRFNQAPTFQAPPAFQR